MPIRHTVPPRVQLDLPVGKPTDTQMRHASVAVTYIVEE